MPLVALTDVSIAFGHLPLLDGASLQIDNGERIAIIGRNGTGKSTLLRILNDELEPDSGRIWRSPGLQSARLDQDVTDLPPRTVFDLLADGLGRDGEIVRAYHHAARQVADGSADALDELARLQQQLDERDAWHVERRVELVINRLKLPADARVETLSGGWRRRVLLGRALVASPDLLLLDEPTNHLDIDAIAWLEDFLAAYAGAVVFVTHDRSFLRRLATRIVELDRGRLTSWPGDYDSYLAKKEALLAAEAREAEKFDRRLAGEEAWLRRGVKARRTRDEGRVRALMAMRDERARRRERQGQVRLEIGSADRSGHVVFEAEHVSIAFDTRTVIDDFSIRIMRGDRIGLVGPNGAGKSTLLRLLTGQLTPDSGEVHRGTGLEIAYFDQQREQLDPERTVFDTIADGNDTVLVQGRPRHVVGYLKDFLFPPERVQSRVKTLSGGERSRLLLARLFTRPANVLILDEPTNDLDLETLELLEAQLADFDGTVLLVSHDRTFLDNVVTSILAFEPDGRVTEYVGGYDDWQRQRPQPVTPEPPPAPRAPAPQRTRQPNPAKLSYKETRELEALPGRIEELEQQIADIETKLASPDFYREAAGDVRETVARLESLQAELEQAYARWEELETRRSAAK
ncbi:MAG: ATP-binding cassette domain-containing protein [Acidobacteriota bacterium]|jgi:ATP-binding cassette subfamily F protein uup|nr:MAG: ABC transporter ATP-binding protein [Acidobacteriota bacterium]